MRLHRMRTLDVIPSIKLKLSLIIVGAVAIAAAVSLIGFHLDWPIWSRPIISSMLGVSIMWFIAGGIVSPLREMADAAGRMARGDYSAAVSETSADEVGDLARAFNAMAAQLAEVDRDRRDLIAMVSHELRTPITALQANLENIVDGVDEADPEVLAKMLGQTERLSRLVSQLLDVSRVQSGSLALSTAEIDVSDLLDRVVDESHLHRPGVPVSVAVDPPDLVTLGDAERLHQVLANLVDNAARFTPQGEEVVVRARSAAPGVRIEVEDRGPGLAPGDLDRIFERYQRGSNARSATSGGTGLGLAIAQWIVELHGGDIAAHNIEPAGCCFVLDLPPSDDRRPT